MLSLTLYLVSGLWGILCLNSTIITSDWALFPSLTGMFGIAGLLMSMNEGVKFPKQVVSKKIDVGNIWKIVVSGLVAGLLIGVVETFSVEFGASGLRHMVSFLFMILVLIFRPGGLLSGKELIHARGD